MMEYEKYKFRVGEMEYDVIHCLGHGQCQCDSCKQRGRYTVSWTSWFYKFKETDEHVLCSDCMTEALVQQRIDAIDLRNYELEKQVAELKAENTELYKEQTTLIAGSILNKQEQKAEIERLNGKYRNLEINYNAVWEDFRKYEVENTELQKQVNELKEENGKLVTIGNGFALERNNLREELDELKEENTELHKERTTLIASSILKQQDIAKDTAKEILQRGKYCMPSGLRDWIKERYGVED